MTSLPADHVRLQQLDDEYRRAAEKHRSYDERLGQLQTKLFLTEEEKLEEVRLKKQKLLAKDRMEEIAARLSGATT